MVMDFNQSSVHSATNQTDSETIETIKPQLIEEDALEILKVLYGFEGGTLKQMNGYDDLNYHFTKAKKTDNPHIKSLWPHGYILKVINTKDSHNRQIQEAQTNLMLFMRKHDIICSVPVKNKLGNYFSVERLPITSEKGRKRYEHVIKLLEFQPGIVLKHVPSNFSLYYQLGEIAARLNSASKNFYHHAYESHESIWHLSMLPKVRFYTYVVEDRQMKEMIECIMDEFLSEVAPKMDLSRRQIIHGDLNSQNIVCQEENQEWKISAIIDFGDTHMSYPLYELAISMFYTMVDCKEKMLDHYVGSGHTLAGYMKASQASKVDFKMLKQSILARLSQSYVLGMYNSILQPENNYISENLEFYPQLLTDIVETPTSVIKEIWENVINSYRNTL